MVCLGQWWRASPKPQGPRSLEFSFLIPALSRTDPGRRDWARRERKSGLSPPPWEQRRREINESCHPFPGSTRAEQFPPRWEDQPLFMSPSEGGTVGIPIFAPSWGAASARFLKGAGDPRWKPGCSPDRKGPLPVKAGLCPRPGARRPRRGQRRVTEGAPGAELIGPQAQPAGWRDRRTFTGPAGASRD